MSGATTSVYVDPNTGGVQAGLMQFRNKIINGNFDVWQRGTSFSLGFNADRWQLHYNGGTRAVTREIFTPGQNIVPGNPVYYSRQSTTVIGTNGIHIFYTKIEGAATLSGSFATISFWAKANANLTISGVNLAQDLGSGGSPSTGSTVAIVSSILITTGWTKFSQTAYIPSISGKTFGTDKNDHLLVAFYCPPTTLFTLDIAQVQLEEGQRATPFEIRPYAIELQLCQRFFEVGLSELACAVNSGTYRGLSTPFKVNKRSKPTINLLTDLGAVTTIDTGRTNEYQASFYNYGGNSLSCTWSASSDI